MLLLCNTLQFTALLELLVVNQLIMEYKRSVDDTYKELENYASWCTEFSDHLLSSVGTYSKMMTSDLSRNHNHNITGQYYYGFDV